MRVTSSITFLYPLLFTHVKITDFQIYPLETGVTFTRPSRRFLPVLGRNLSKLRTRSKFSEILKFRQNPTSMDFQKFRSPWKWKSKLSNTRVTVTSDTTSTVSKFQLPTPKKVRKGPKILILGKYIISEFSVLS